MSYSNLTIDQEAHRSQLKSLMDNFCFFTWNGKDSWDEYGMFIINDKSGSLKFYNGPSFSNEYSNPLYSKYTNLDGVKFNTQQVSFQVGIYYFTDADYQDILKWLDPLTIAKLGFSFNTTWGYYAKLAGIEDSTRHILAKSSDTYYYYTELTLKFDIQGNACLTTLDECKLECSGNKQSTSINFNSYNWPKSILEYPVKIELIYDETSSEETTSISLQVNEQTLFSFDCIPSYFSQKTIIYDSESGLIYYLDDNNKYRLLTQLLFDVGDTSIVTNLVLNKDMLSSNTTKLEIECTGPVYLKSVEVFPRNNVI